MDFVLRKWVPEDAESVAHYADNPRIARNLRDTFPCPYTLRDAESYIASVMEGEDRQLCRAIVVAGAAAGGIGVFPGSDVYRKSAEIGYWLAEEYWNQGIMTSAVRQICKEAFKKLDIVRIYAEPYVYNAGSRAVLQTTGFSWRAS